MLVVIQPVKRSLPRPVTAAGRRFVSRAAAHLPVCGRREAAMLAVREMIITDTSMLLDCTRTYVSGMCVVGRLLDPMFRLNRELQLTPMPCFIYCWAVTMHVEAVQAT